MFDRPTLVVSPRTRTPVLQGAFVAGLQQHDGTIIQTGLMQPTLQVDAINVAYVQGWRVDKILSQGRVYEGSEIRRSHLTEARPAIDPVFIFAQQTVRVRINAMTGFDIGAIQQPMNFPSLVVITDIHGTRNRVRAQPSNQLALAAIKPIRPFPAAQHKNFRHIGAAQIYGLQPDSGTNYATRLPVTAMQHAQEGRQQHHVSKRAKAHHQGR